VEISHTPPVHPEAARSGAGLLQVERDPSGSGRRRLTPRWRKLLMVVHLIVSLGLLGSDAAVLVLVIAGWLGSAASTVYPAAYLLGVTLLVPLGLLALVTGILQGLLTPWGLLRYWWVVVKLVLIVAGNLLAVFVLVPSLAAAAQTAATGTLPDNPFGLVRDASGATTVLIVTVVLSIYKPFGRLRGRMRRP
jgi:hypothetical protein